MFFFTFFAAREGLEPTTNGLDLVGGIEPPSPVTRGILPLNYTRLVCFGKPLLIQSSALTIAPPGQICCFKELSKTIFMERW